MNYRFPSFRDFGCQKIHQLQIQTQMPQSQILYCSRYGNSADNPNSSHLNSLCSNLMTPQLRKYPFKQAEISFESYFLVEHVKAFDDQTKNFMEIFYRLIEKSLEEKHMGQDKISDDFPGNSCSDLLYESKNGVNQKIQISCSEKLNQFFNHIRKTVPVWFIPWYTQLWTILKPQYFKMKDVALNQEEILGQAKRLARNKYEDLIHKRGVHQLFRNSSQDLQLDSIRNSLEKSLIQYIEFFFTTVILINQQYFSNPYYESGLKAKSFTISAEFSSFQGNHEQI